MDLDWKFRNGDTLQLDGDPTSGRAALMPWHQEPGVLLGHKPVGPVSVNRNHPFGRHVGRMYLAPSAWENGGVAPELVGTTYYQAEAEGEAFSTDEAAGSYIEMGDKTHMGAKGSTDVLVFSIIGDTGRSPVYDVIDTAPWVDRLVLNSTSGDNYSVGNIGRIIRTNNSKTTTAYISPGDALLNNGELHTLVVTTRNLGGTVWHTFYMDGVKYSETYASQIGGSGNFNSVSDKSYWLGTRNNRGTAYYGFNTTKMYLYARSNLDVADGLAQKLSLNPYQFLKPAGP